MDKVIQSVDKLELSTRVKDHLEYTYEQYMEYLESLHELPAKTLKYYLRTLKDKELINNQETELEDNFLMELYRNQQRKDSIGIVTKSFEDHIITKDELKKLHRIVIKGSSDDIAKNYNYRQDNDKWVGGFDQIGNRLVDYYPPDYRELDVLLDYTLEILNDDETKNDLNHILIKPFVIHGMIAYMQPFGNGNTRLSRVLQHGKIWHMTNTRLDRELELPILYLSKHYLQTRPQYRELISKIANEQDWNAWINYNLNMADENLYWSQDNLAKVKKML